ncbi:MAG: FHA domain-containing protein [Gemmataceae bacterium]
MVKCPFCQFENEDGALFCEQCKSDLAAAEPLPLAQPIAEVHDGMSIPVATPIPEAIPIAADAVNSAAPPHAGPAEEPLPDASTFVPAHPEPEAPSETLVASSETFVAPIPAAPNSASSSSPMTMAATPVYATPGLAAGSAEPSVLPAEAQPRLLVLRGQKRNVEYPLYEGQNFIGRADEKPVDIDLEDQEPPDRVWCSRQHCLITFQEGKLAIEDLNSANGTFVNRSRIYPGKSQVLNVNDVIQIGNVQLRVIV